MRIVFLSVLFLIAACQTPVQLPENGSKPENIDTFWKISKAQELTIHRQKNPNEDFVWCDWIPEEVIEEVKAIANEYRN